MTDFIDYVITIAGTSYINLVDTLPADDSAFLLIAYCFSLLSVFAVILFGLVLVVRLFSFVCSLFRRNS